MKNNPFESSQSSYTKTIFRGGNPSQDFLNLNKLIQQCKKYSIIIIQLPDKRLQAGLNVLPFKAKYKDMKQTIVVFVTKYQQKHMVVTGYYDGKKIQKTNILDEIQLTKIIRKWLQNKKFNKEDNQNRMLKMIQNLNKKCIEISQQKKQMIAIQKLKSSNQYQQVIEHQIKLVKTIERLTQQLLKVSQDINGKDKVLLQKILKIENIKNQIEEFQYQYEETCKYVKNVKQLINTFYQQQLQKVQNIYISNQNELNQFLVEAKKLKKLELQKRFLY